MINEELQNRQIRKIKNYESKKRSNLINNIIIGTSIFVGSSMMLYGIGGIININKKSPVNNPSIKLEEELKQYLVDQFNNPDLLEEKNKFPDKDHLYRDGIRPFFSFESYNRNKKFNI